MTGLTVTPPAAKADAKLLYELSALGNNANQLSRHMNAGRDFAEGWEELTEQIYTTLDRIWALYGME